MKFKQIKYYADQHKRAELGRLGRLGRLGLTERMNIL
jgi:hypothetical protein